MTMNLTDITGVADNEAAAPGQYDDEKSDLIKEISDNLKKGRNHLNDWRMQARESYDFFAGVQWDELDRQKLNKEGRPPVVFNRIARTINAVAGVEVQNRQEVKYIPRHVTDSSAQQQPEQSPMPGMQPEGQQQNDSTNDSGFSDMLNAAAKWVREQNGAEDEESEAFQDCLQCGMGWTETAMSYDEDPQGMIIKNRIDPLQMLYDPYSTKRNLEDAKWVACIKDFDRKEVKKMFPQLQLNVETGTFWNDSDMSVHNADDDWKYINDQSDRLTKVGQIAVVQYQYWVKEPMYIILTEDGNIIKMDKERHDKAQKLIDMKAVKKVKIQKKIFKQCFVVGNEITDETDLGCDHFTFRAITGLRDRNRNVWFGLVDLMKDPQRWANKWLSQIQHIINTNSKGGVLVETGAAKNMRKLEDDWSSPDAVIELNPGGLNKIQQKTAAPYPDGVDKLLNYAVNAINDIPGVNLEMVGMANRDQPIGLEETRKDAGITVLANFFDALRRYRKLDGRIMAYYIREYIADGRLIRILGKEGAKYIPLIKDKLAFEYDIIVDDAPTSPNSKARTFAIFNQIMPMVMQAGIPIPPEILDYAPLPEAFIQQWKELISSSNKPDPQKEQMQQELDQINLVLARLAAEKAEAEIQKVGSETAKNYAAAEKDHAVGQEQSALAMQKFGVIQSNQQMKDYEMQKNMQRKDLEATLTHARKMLEIELENRLKNKRIQGIPSLNTIQ